MTTQRLNLSIIPGGMKPILNVSQYDKGQTWIFTLFEGSTTYSIPAGSVVTIAGTKKDNTGFQYPCTYSGANVTAIEEQQMTIFPGDVQAELRISNGDELVATINFVIRVEAAALKNDVLISDTELPLIEEAAEVGEHIDEWKAEIEGYAEDSEAYALGTRGGTPVTPDDPAYHNNALYYNANTEEIVASAWSDSTAYAVGDYVIDDHKLYRCIQANTAQQPPAASYWLEVKVGDELERIEAAAGVSSFNGRTGAVTPTAHDYDAADIDYDGTAAGRTADDVQEAIDEAFDEIDDITADTQFLNTSHHYDYAVVQEITAIGVDAGDVKVKIEPVQSGSGDPSPTNPRPISGWTKEYISVSGKNLIFKKIENCNIGTGGNLQSNNDYDVFVALIKKGITYFPTTGSGSFIYTLFTDEPSMGSVSYTGTRYVVGEEAYTATIDGFIAFRTTKANSGVAQFEKGKVATAHEDFKGSTYTIDLDGTRYGGVIDVATGELTETHALETFNGSGVSWTYQYQQGDYAWFKTTIPAKASSECISNLFPYKSAVGAYEGVYINSSGALIVGIANSRLQTVDANGFKTWLTSNNLSVVYELDTPITVQLSPTQIKLLKGYNNISANSGDISVDVYSLVESVSRVEDEVETKANKVDLTSIAITGTTNNTGSAISQGTFFYLNGALVRAKTSIASGATLTLNTNYEVVTAGGLNEFTYIRTPNAVSGVTEIHNSQECIVDLESANLGSITGSYSTVFTVSHPPKHALYISCYYEHHYMFYFAANGNVQAKSVDGNTYTSSFKTQIRYTLV